MSVPDWSVGHIVGRRYTVQQVLGRTPFSRTYSALTEPNKEVVLRVFGPESNEAVDELMEHLPDLSTFPDSGVLRVLEIGHDPATGARFVVTERSRHPSLASMVELCPLAPAEGLAFAQQLARTIDLAHSRKLLHLGLKPSNVFVGTMPNGSVEVADFSIPRVGPISFEQARWQAPEQIAEHQPTAAADVFSTALVVFHALTGKSYWRATGVEELAGELSAPRVSASARAAELGVTLSKDLDAAFAAALASDPAKRPGHAGDFVAGLMGKPIVIPPRTSTPPQKTSPAAPPVVVIEDVPPPPDDLLRTVAPILAPATFTPDEAPTAKSATSAPAEAPAPPTTPPAWKEEPPTDPVQTTPMFDQPSAPVAAWPEPPPVLPSHVARKRRVTTIALSAVAGTLFLLAAIIVVIALRKKPTASTDSGAPSASVASAAPSTTPAVPATTLANITPSAAPSDAPSAAPQASASPESSTPTLALGPQDSELFVHCDPQPCSLVMVDRKKMREYPEPMIIAPGAHGVGIDAEGCWGDWKLVTTKAGERTTVTFNLNKRPPGVPYVPYPSAVKKKTVIPF